MPLAIKRHSQPFFNWEDIMFNTHDYYLYSLSGNFDDFLVYQMDELGAVPLYDAYTLLDGMRFEKDQDYTLFLLRYC